MVSCIQIEEFEKTVDNLIFDHFKTIHGDSQDIIFCPDYRINIILKTSKETVSYHTELIDMTKKYTINEIIKDREILHFFMKTHLSYNITILCQFDDKDDKVDKVDKYEKNENNNDRTIVLLNKDIK